MNQYIKDILRENNAIFIYLGLHGYKLITENDTFYLKNGESKAPISYEGVKDGALELVCDFEDKRIYIKIKNGKQSFCVKQNNTSFTGVHVTKDGTFEIFLNDKGIHHRLSLSPSEFSFSYDAENINIAAKCYLEGKCREKTICFLDMVAKVSGKIVCISVERMKKTHSLLFHGEVSNGNDDFKPLVKVKRRNTKELPSSWVDSVLFPKDDISYLENTVEEIERVYPGFIDYMQRYNATFANVFPANRRDVPESSLTQVWPYVMENIKRKSRAYKTKTHGQTLSLSFAPQKSQL